MNIEMGYNAAMKEVLEMIERDGEVISDPIE